jgi:hypothetical protein
VRWPITEGVEARAALDGAVVGREQLAAWAVGPDEVRAAAAANLAATDPGLDPIGPGAPAWVPTAPAGNPPAWLAAPDALLAATGLSEAVALAPVATELVVVDPAAHDLLASVLTGTTAILAEQTEVLHRAALLVRPGAVTEWQPAPDHPCAPQAHALRDG